MTYEPNKNILKAILNTHRIQHLEETDTTAYAVIKSLTTNKNYIVYLENGINLCTCESNHYQNTLCIHKQILITTIKTKLLNNIIKGDENMAPAEYIKSNLEAINKLIGGIPIGTGTMIMGQHTAGKTLLILQIIFDIIKKGNVLLIDSEGNKHSFEPWMNTFKTRFDTDIQIVDLAFDSKVELTPKEFDKNKPIVFIADITGIHEMLTFHGRQCEFKISEGGKLELTPVDGGYLYDVSLSPIAKFIAKNNIKGVIYDSISMPACDFLSSRQNAPARSDAIKTWLSVAMQLGIKHNIAFIGTSHITKDPTNKYDRVDHYGGKAVAHVFKFVLLLKKGQDTNRELIVERAPTLPDMKEKKMLKITDIGFMDLDEKKEKG